MDKISISEIVGAMEGMVMLHICRHFPAPSMRAASNISWSMPAMAAMKMMEFHPNSFQSSDSTEIAQKLPASASMLLCAGMRPI